MFRIIRVLILCVAAFTTCVIAAENGSLPKIAFFAEHEGGLHQLDLGSGEISEIDVGMPNIGNLAYSPQMQVLAFEGSGGHHESRSLYLLHLKGHKKELIYDANSNKTLLYRPEFDPKGEYLYAVNYSDGIYQYSLSEKSWKSVRISDVKGLNPQGLALSKSGRQVAISPGKFDGFLIARVENSRFVVQKHVLDDFDSCTSAQWIGDDAIVFAGRRKPGLQYIWKLDLESNRVTQITNPPVGARDFLSLSKDEKTIVFTATGEKLEWRLWQVSVNGTGLKQLTEGGTLSSHLSPVWLE